MLRGEGPDDLRELAECVAGDLAEAAEVVPRGRGARAGGGRAAPGGRPGHGRALGRVPGRRSGRLDRAGRRCRAPRSGSTSRLPRRVGGGRRARAGIGEVARWLGVGPPPRRPVDRPRGGHRAARARRAIAWTTGDPLAVIHARDEWAGERARDMARRVFRVARRSRPGPWSWRAAAAMPELPEVETIRAPAGRADPGAHLHARGGPRRQAREPGRPGVVRARSSPGRAIEAVDRRGKYLLIELDAGRTLAIHLRMTGRLHWQAGPPDGGRALPARALPPRRRQHPHLRRHAPLRPGLDRPRRRRASGRPTGARASASSRSRPASRRACWQGLLAGRRGPIKAVLLNQVLVAGLGNMYVDEALFRRASTPLRPAGTLDADEIRAPAPRDPRPAGRRGGGGRRVDRQLPRRPGGEGVDAGPAARPPARGRALPALRHDHPQDPRRPARHLLVPDLPAGAGAVVSEIAGVRVGHWTDAAAGTGCTVVLPPPGTVGAVEVRGGGPATRDVEVLAPARLGAGGDGPAARRAAARSASTRPPGWCAGARSAAWATTPGAARVPIVPAACIYDLGITGNAAPPGRRRRLRRLRGRAPGPARGGQRRRGHRRHRRQAPRQATAGARAASARACAASTTAPPSRRWRSSTPGATSSTSPGRGHRRRRRRGRPFAARVRAGHRLAADPSAPDGARATPPSSASSPTAA